MYKYPVAISLYCLSIKDVRSQEEGSLTSANKGEGKFLQV